MTREDLMNATAGLCEGMQVERRSEGRGRRGGGMDERRELREGGRKEKRRGEGSEEDNYGGGR